MSRENPRCDMVLRLICLALLGLSKETAYPFVRKYLFAVALNGRFDETMYQNEVERVEFPRRVPLHLEPK